MKVKIDTKEKFHILTLLEPVLSANMTEEFTKELISFLEKDIKNVVLKMEFVEEISSTMANCLAGIQQQFYEHEASFVVCELKPEVENYLDGTELLEVMNVTPSESEAWDIVQLEEIERELM